MEIDNILKDRVELYMDKHYYINDENLVMTTNDEAIDPNKLYNDMIDIFGLDVDFAHYIVFGWLYLNEMADIKDNWRRLSTCSVYDTSVTGGTYTTNVTFFTGATTNHEYVEGNATSSAIMSNPFGIFRD